MARPAFIESTTLKQQKMILQLASQNIEEKIILISFLNSYEVECRIVFLSNFSAQRKREGKIQILCRCEQFQLLGCGDWRECAQSGLPTRYCHVSRSTWPGRDVQRNHLCRYLDSYDYLGLLERPIPKQCRNSPAPVRLKKNFLHN